MRYLDPDQNQNEARTSPVGPSSEHAVVHGEELRLSLEAADFALDGAVDTLLSPGREGLRRSVEAADRAIGEIAGNMT